MAIITMFAYNILEAAYAVKYPRPPLPQITSPAAKSKNSAAFSPTPKRAFKVLSPNVRLLSLNLFLFSQLFFYYYSPAHNRRNHFRFLHLPLLPVLPSRSPLLHLIPPILNLLFQHLRGWCITPYRLHH